MDTYSYVMDKVACEEDPTCTFKNNATLDQYQEMYALDVGRQRSTATIFPLLGHLGHGSAANEGQTSP